MGGYFYCLPEPKEELRNKGVDGSTNIALANTRDVGRDCTYFISSSGNILLYPSIMLFKLSYYVFHG